MTAKSNIVQQSLRENFRKTKLCSFLVINDGQQKNKVLQYNNAYLYRLLGYILDVPNDFLFHEKLFSKMKI